MREVIKQMLATENEARQIVSSASEEGDKLVAQARALATAIEEKTRAEVQAAAGELVTRAERESRLKHDELIGQARAEAKKLTASGARTEEAIGVVIREALGKGI